MKIDKLPEMLINKLDELINASKNTKKKKNKNPL
jgi:hypothetical protein